MLLGAIGRKSLRDSASQWMTDNGFSDYKMTFAPGDAVGIDYAANRIAIQSNGKQKIIAFADLVSVEICEDGETVSKTNRSGQALGAAVGAIALGPVGALIGGLSGSKTSRQKISKASINLITKDIDMPFAELKIYQGQPIDKGGFIYNQSTKDTMEWYGRLRAIIETF